MPSEEKNANAMRELMIEKLRAKYGLNKMEIDMYMGWNMHEYDKDMQEKYAGQQRAVRVKRRFITSSC